MYYPTIYIVIPEFINLVRFVLTCDTHSGFIGRQSMWQTFRFVDYATFVLLGCGRFKMSFVLFTYHMGLMVASLRILMSFLLLN